MSSKRNVLLFVCEDAGCDLEDYQTLASLLTDFTVNEGDPIFLFIAQDGKFKNMILRPEDLGTCRQLSSQNPEVMTLVTELNNGSDVMCLAGSVGDQVSLDGQGDLRVLRIVASQALTDQLLER